MPCSGFVWLLCLIEGSGQTSFCDVTMPYMEGHSVGIQLCHFWGREKWIFCHLFSAVTLNPGILAKWECSTREFWSTISNVHCTAFSVGMIMPFVYFCDEGFWNDTEVCTSPCLKILFLKKVLLTYLVCYLSTCDSWLIFTCMCLLQTLINPICKDKLWLMYILKIYT